MNQLQCAGAPHLRLWAAFGLGLTSIAASILLLTADGIGGSVHWAHHAGASAAPLLLIAGAIAAISVTHPPGGYMASCGWQQSLPSPREAAHSYFQTRPLPEL